MTTDNTDTTPTTFVFDPANPPAEVTAWFESQVAPINERAAADAKKAADLLAEVKALKTSQKTVNKDLTDNATLQAHFEGLLAESDGRFTALAGSIAKSEITNQVNAAIAEEKGNAPILAPHIASRVKGEYDPATNAVKVTVLDENGNEMLVRGKPATVKDLVASFKANSNFAVLFEGSGVTGSGSTTTSRITTVGDNPYKSKNITKQFEIERTNPELAKRLKAEAAR